MKYILFLASILLSNFSIAQKEIKFGGLTVEEAFRPKAPTYIDTIFYPFYNGVQMIEVDHIGFWDRHIFFLEQSQPMSMPHSYYNPMPIGNEYFFRDTSGVIVKAYNSTHSLAALTKHFETTAMNKKSTGIAFFFKYHNNQGYRTGVWYQSPQAMFDFPGHYKVSTGHAKQTALNIGYSADPTNYNLKFGLIDSLGNEVIPIEFNEIYPFYENLLVRKDQKWGIINYKNEVVVPLSYENYEIDRRSNTDNPETLSNVLFRTSKESSNERIEYQFSAVYFTEKNQLISLNNYDEVNHDYTWSPMDDQSKRFIYISKNGKRGLLNEDYQEIVPPRYELFEFSKYSQGLFRVAQEGKFGFWDKNFNEIIPLEYDYAEKFTSDSTALVLKNGNFYCIDTKNKKQSNGKTTPEWKIGHLGFVTDKNYISVQTNNLVGMIDISSNSIILPIKYKSLTPIEINAFFEKNKALFREKKIEFNQTPDMIDELLFHKNKIIVKNNRNQFGLIDTTFNVLIQFEYENLEAIQCNLNYLIYIQNGKLGAMDYSSKDLLSKEYEEVRYSIHYEQERDIFQVKDNGKWGIVNFENKTLVPCEYDSIRFLGHWNRPKIKLWVVEKNKQFGVVDENNKTFVPFQDDHISHLEGHNLWLDDKDKKRYKVYFAK